MGRNRATWGTWTVSVSIHENRNITFPALWNPALQEQRCLPLLLYGRICYEL